MFRLYADLFRATFHELAGYRLFQIRNGSALSSVIEMSEATSRQHLCTARRGRRGFWCELRTCESNAAEQPCRTSAASVSSEGDGYAEEQHLEARQPPSIDRDHRSQRPDDE
jgi:hypothetical protein